MVVSLDATSRVNTNYHKKGMSEKLCMFTQRVGATYKLEPAKSRRSNKQTIEEIHNNNCND